MGTHVIIVWLTLDIVVAGYWVYFPLNVRASMLNNNRMDLIDGKMYPYLSNSIWSGGALLQLLEIVECKAFWLTSGK